MQWVVSSFFALVLFCGSASALPPFLRGVEMRYGQSVSADFAIKIGRAKCDICHTGTSKKLKNAYGDELAKFLKKENFSNNRLQTNPRAAYAEIIEAFKKVEKLKAPDGRTYEERLSDGLLPIE